MALITLIFTSEFTIVFMMTRILNLNFDSSQINRGGTILVIEITTIYLKITQSHVFLQNLAKSQYFLKLTSLNQS